MALDIPHSGSRTGYLTVLFRVRTAIPQGEEVTIDTELRPRPVALRLHIQVLPDAPLPPKETTPSSRFDRRNGQNFSENTRFREIGVYQKASRKLPRFGRL